MKSHIVVYVLWLYTDGFIKDYGNPPSMPDRVGSYGVGMIGVGGVSSYGR